MDDTTAAEQIRSLSGDRYDATTIDKIAPFLDTYLKARPLLAQLELGSVPNALVLPAGGRK
jgi:hypothetical protein